MSATLPSVGFYGKLPTHGDFVRRRVSSTFARAWDDWLQQCLAASQYALGERWLDVYLTSPAWFFVCAPDACGAAPVAGVMAPSVDRTGRYFPLTLSAELPAATNIVGVAARGGRFFQKAERLVVNTLAADHVDFGRFDDDVRSLGSDLGPLIDTGEVILDPSVARVLDAQPASWQLPLSSAGELASAFEQTLHQRLSAVCDPLVIWWTDGSERVEPSCLIHAGMPDPDQYTAMLAGDWRAGRWCMVPGQRRVAVAEAADATHALVVRSAAATHVGCVRRINQDAFVDRPDVGVWAVADGLGGHNHGEVASRMVCDALTDFAPRAGFDEAIEDARSRIEEVNEYLVRAAARSSDAAGSGSTVVALLARGPACAILWAGDSRAYRLRAGRFEQLTRDHASQTELTPGAHDTHGVTRAVGGERDLLLDVHVDRIRAGDRYLLCSDGLTRTLCERDIHRHVAEADVHAGVDRLIAATLAAGAPDNVTALIVEAVE